MNITKTKKVGITMLSYLFTLLPFTSMAQRVIDVHSHIITPEFLSTLREEGRLLDEGFPLPKYSVDTHLQWMDAAGVTTSVLTLAAPQPLSAEAVRRANEAAAQLKRAHPERFLFCAALPLPDVKAAIDEAQYALDVLKADGIKLATNVGGQYLGDEALDTLFAVLNERRAVVILHPHRPEPVNADVMRQTPLAMQEYLSETTRAVANMITRDVLSRYPDVRVVVPHCGAYLPLAVPRMKSLVPVMQKNNLVGPIDWERNLSSLYYDLAGAHSPETIRMMLTITTPDHLLYGSDYPYVAPEVLTAGLNRMKDYLSAEPDLAPYREMILSGNAERLFGKKNAANTPESVPFDDAAATAKLLVRIAEIEVFPDYLEEYLTYANDVDRISVEREPGVVCLYPMQSDDDPTQIRILEIYASDEAYQAHLKTEHFLKYKTGTAHMVKSLKLNTMQPLDPATMKLIFKKQK